MNRIVFAAAALSLCACAFGAGEPFGTVTGNLSARVDPPSGFTPLSTGYAVQITGAAFSVDALRIVGEPATPEGPGPEQVLLEIPAGYPLVALGGTADTVASVPLECSDVCALPQSQLSAARATLTAFEVVATVRDTRTPARIAETTYTVSFVAKPSAPGHELSTEVSLPIDRTHFPNIDVDAAIVGTPQMFEGIDFAALDGNALGDAQNRAARDAVLAAFEPTALDVHTVRSP